jgi:stalled ribosome rescue protein Dom34
MSGHNAKKLVGIWLDSSKAVIITQDAAESGSYRIHETVKGREKHGGGSEHSMNNAKQSEDLKYMKSVAALLLPYDEIFIFGPGQSQEQLQHHLKAQPQFSNKKMTVNSSGQLTDNQAVAAVREFFRPGS